MTPDRQQQPAPTDHQQPFHPALTRRLIQAGASPSSAGSGGAGGNQKQQQPKRISTEALLAAGELLRLFVCEARHRAGIEAECEKEAAVGSTTLATSGQGMKAGKDVVQIQPHHISKIAAELLMDFS